MKTVTVTRKIQLLISPIRKSRENDESLGSRKKEMQNKAYGMCKFNHKIANMCINRCIHYYGLDNKLYMDTDKDNRNTMSRAIYSDLVGFTETDSYLSKYFSKASKNTSYINVEVSKKYRSEAFNVAIKGDKSLTTYKEGFPLYVKSRDILRKISVGDKLDIENIIFRQYGVDFKMFFGRDSSNSREIISRINKGECKACDSKIIVKKNKIFLLLSVTMPQQEKKLDKSIVVGADLGINTPIVASVFKSPYGRQYIGSREELFKQRTSIRARRKRLQSQLVTASGGKGRKKKLKGLDKLNESEKNIRNNFNHIYSKAIIQFCIKKNAGVLVMENLSKFGKTEDGKSKDKLSYILSNWSYFDLQSKIEYKAKQVGIDVHYIKPQYTSQRCSKCGNIHSDNRNRLKFKCLDCGHEMNADLNASQNIADVFINNLILKKECIY